MLFSSQTTRRVARFTTVNTECRFMRKARPILQDRKYTTGPSEGIPGPLHPNHDIYVSTSINPYFNLSLEDWLFRHSPQSKPLLLIYRDAPCVVIGRNQNPWTELNFSALGAANVPFLRRRSGGGAVYHDLGNTNFSIHLPRASFDRHATGDLVLRAVQSLGIDARLNDRNDICIGPEKMSSAYKIATKRAYHHGTMLLATQLAALGDFLRPQAKNIVTKGVASVRSPVCNLQKYSAGATNETFTSAVVSAFSKEYGVTSKPYLVSEEMCADIGYIGQGMEELKTWEWTYGATPGFTHTLTRSFPWADIVAVIDSKHGLIMDVDISASEPRMPGVVMTELNQQCHLLFAGQRYGFLEASTNCAPIEATSSAETALALREVWEWLREATAVAS